MKKQLLLIVALFMATAMSAQFYAGIDLGYALGAAKRANGTEISGTKTTNIYGSYGQGFGAGLKLGFMFNDNFGFELGVNYLMGATLTKTKTEDILEEAKSSGLRLMPQLVYQFDNGFYGRFGMIVPVAGSTKITETDNKYMVGPNTFVKKETEMITHGSFSIGYIGAIGYRFELSDNMFLFGELEYIGLAIKSKTAEFTKYEVNGKDVLDNMKTAQKEYEFVDEIDSSVTPDPNSPTKLLKQSAPFSSFGLNIGLTMSF